MIISGIGERPAIVHMQDFGVVGFTSGSVCIAPYLSTMLLRAMNSGDPAKAEKYRALFFGVEDVRDAYSSIRVLHTAVTLSRIAGEL